MIKCFFVGIALALPLLLALVVTGPVLGSKDYWNPDHRVGVSAIA